MPQPEDQKAQDDVRELRSAAVRLRDLISQFREAAGYRVRALIGRYLLEGIAECVANGQRLRYKRVRFVDQRLTRTASSTTTLAQITGGPGSIVYHSYVGGVGATNLSWMERNFSINQPAGNVNTVEMATDLWSKSGGVPFTTSAVIRSLPIVQRPYRRSHKQPHQVSTLGAAATASGPSRWTGG
jgi:hypothetical protein